MSVCKNEVKRAHYCCEKYHPDSTKTFYKSFNFLSYKAYTEKKAVFLTIDIPICSGINQLLSITYSQRNNTAKVPFVLQKNGNTLIHVTI